MLLMKDFPTKHSESSPSRWNKFCIKNSQNSWHSFDFPI